MIIEDMTVELCVKFHEWMQQYQDISTAKRILEVESDYELFGKFIDYLNEED